MECLKKNEIHQNLCEEGMNFMLTKFCKIYKYYQFITS